MSIFRAGDLTCWLRHVTNEDDIAPQAAVEATRETGIALWRKSGL